MVCQLHSRVLRAVLVIAVLAACPTASAIPPLDALAPGAKPARGTLAARPLPTLVPPANDAIGDALTVTAVPGTISLDTTDATTAGDDPTCAGANAASVWFAYTAPVSTWLEVLTIGSSYDTVLAVYTGTPGSLVEVACNDDASGGVTQSYVDISVSAGVTYYVMVAGRIGGGSLVLDVDVSPPLPLTGVRATAAVERYPAAGAGGLAWSQRPRTGRFYALLLKPTSGKQTRLNKARTSGFAGGFDAKRLAYQEARVTKTSARSDIRLFNLKTRKRSNPAGVNTRQWEWSPSISGDYLLFGRDARASVVILRNLKRRTQVVLDRVTARNSQVWPAHVNGNYATWFRCTPRCDVFLYDIAARSKTKIPNPLGRQQYSSTVTPDGTVYFVSSGTGCGAAVRLERKSPGRPTVTLASLGAKLDSTQTSAVHHPNGTTSVFLDVLRCTTFTSDVVKIVDP